MIFSDDDSNTTRLKEYTFFIPFDLLCVKVMQKVAKQGKNGKKQNVKKLYFYKFIVKI